VFSEERWTNVLFAQNAADLCGLLKNKELDRKLVEVWNSQLLQIALVHCAKALGLKEYARDTLYTAMMELLKHEVQVETEMMRTIHIDVDDEVDDSDIGVDEHEVDETQMMPEVDEIPFMEKVENDDIWSDGMNIHDHEVMVEILIIEIDEIEVEEILIITEKIQVDDDDLYGETEVSDEQ
jgi:hypothetical protein